LIDWSIHRCALCTEYWRFGINLL